MSRKKSENYYTLDHANKFADRERPNANRTKNRQITSQSELAVDAVADVRPECEDEIKTCRPALEGGR